MKGPSVIWPHKGEHCQCMGFDFEANKSWKHACHEYTHGRGVLDTLNSNWINWHSLQWDIQGQAVHCVWWLVQSSLKSSLKQKNHSIFIVQRSTVCCFLAQPLTIPKMHSEDLFTCLISHLGKRSGQDKICIGSTNNVSSSWEIMASIPVEILQQQTSLFSCKNLTHSPLLYTTTQVTIVLFMILSWTGKCPTIISTDAYPHFSEHRILCQLTIETLPYLALAELLVPVSDTEYVLGTSYCSVTIQWCYAL